ncbi:hypothetical protein F8S13_05775 [Chloroflexia bacterium SDU3-3]|nr:hypothetical protein F8S13_05775 [Chloroflexia bacterium SDU3-3]
MFILDIPETKDIDMIKSKFNNYIQYINSIQENLPQETFEFAIASWHYDGRDPKCPNDAWLENMNISEHYRNESQCRYVDINIRLLGAYHDGYINLHYKDVKFYTLGFIKESKEGDFNELGHGDWLIDEIFLGDNGNVVHKIRFSEGSQWEIQCNNIIYTWNPS